MQSSPCPKANLFLYYIYIYINIYLYYIILCYYTLDHQKSPIVPLKTGSMVTIPKCYLWNTRLPFLRMQHILLVLDEINNSLFASGCHRVKPILFETFETGASGHINPESQDNVHNRLKLLEKKKTAQVFNLRLASRTKSFGQLHASRTLSWCWNCCCVHVYLVFKVTGDCSRYLMVPLDKSSEEPAWNCLACGW